MPGRRSVPAAVSGYKKKPDRNPERGKNNQKISPNGAEFVAQLEQLGRGSECVAKCGCMTLNCSYLCGGKNEKESDVSGMDGWKDGWMDSSQKEESVALKSHGRWCVSASTCPHRSLFVSKAHTGSVLTLYMDETISFPFSALIGRTRQKMCAPELESCSAASSVLVSVPSSFLLQSSPLSLFCLNETSPCGLL